MSDITKRMQLCKLDLEEAALNADRAFFIDTYSSTGAAMFEAEMCKCLRRALTALGFRIVPINGGESGTEADVVNEEVTG